MLGIIAFLSRRLGPEIGCDGSIWFLREIHETLKPKHVGHHLVTLAFELLPSKKLDLLCKWVADGMFEPLPKEDDRYFRDIGLLYGAKPKLPWHVLKECRWRNKYIYSGILGSTKGSKDGETKSKETNQTGNGSSL